MEAQHHKLLTCYLIWIEAPQPFASVKKTHRQFPRNSSIFPCIPSFLTTMHLFSGDRTHLLDLCTQNCHCFSFRTAQGQKIFCMIAGFLFRAKLISRGGGRAQKEEEWNFSLRSWNLPLGSILGSQMSVWLLTYWTADVSGENAF